MTNVSLNAYVNLGLKDLDGEVRIARGTEDKLINKGTFGHSVASFFESIGRAFGSRPDPTLAQRQSDAFDGFKKALAGHFGNEVAELALREARLTDDDGVKRDDAALTGRAMLEATQHAKAIVHGNRADNQQNVEKFLPPRDGEEVSQQFARIAQNMDPPLDPGGLDIHQKVAFNMRLEDAIRAESVLGREKLGEERIEALATRALKDVLRLSATGGLDQAERARDAYTDSIKELVNVVGHVSTKPKELVDAMMSCHQRFQALVQAEGKQLGPEELRNMEQKSMFLAMHELSTEKPGLMRLAQFNLHADDSPLKALYGECTRQLDNTENSNHQIRLAGMLNAISDSLASNLAKALTPRTERPSSDVAQLGDGDVKPRTSEAMRRAFGPVLEGVRHDLTPGKTFVSDVLRDFSGIVPLEGDEIGDDPGNEIFAWGKSAPMLQELERRVTDHAHVNYMSTGDSIADFREAFKSTDMHPGLRAKLMAGLDAMEGERTLRRELDRHEEFRMLGDDQNWCLFAPGTLQDDGVSKWDLEIHNEGSLAGMNRMLAKTLQDHREGVPLDSGSLISLHELGARDSYTELLMLLFRTGGAYTDPEAHMSMRVDRLLPPGLRNDNVTLTLRLGTQTTPEGIQEMRDFMQGDPWFESSREIAGDEPGFEIVFSMPPSEEATKARMDKIFEDYNAEISASRTDDDKLNAIGRAVQNLYRTHLFADGNTRTSVLMTMNRMLMDQGLSPSILREPKGAAGFSHAQFVQQIRDGQETFQEKQGGV